MSTVIGQHFSLFPKARFTFDLNPTNDSVGINVKVIEILYIIGKNKAIISPLLRILQQVAASFS